jgi:hypothetical protein
MTLKEEFKQWLDTNPRLQIREIQLEAIADDYAIEFAEWLSMFTKEFEDGDLRYWNKDKWIRKTSKELLEIFKKENGL